MNDLKVKDSITHLINFLTELRDSDDDYIIPDEDPVLLGVNFLKMGTFLLKGDLDEEDFIDLVTRLYDDAPAAVVPKPIAKA